MGVLTAPKGAFCAPEGAERAPKQAELALSYDLTTEIGSINYARELARRTVMATQQDARTVDAAIFSITARYQFRSFIKKLWKGERVVIRAHLLNRLERAHDDAMRSLERRWS